MKGGTIQIAWHGSEPVLSLDFHNLSGLLATAGADHDIKLWSVHQKENAAPTVKFEADLCYHSKAVNVLRFSPSGHLLASGGDGGEILIWKPVEGTDKQPSWKVSRTLQLHLRDVLDLTWSPDSSFLMSGSVDNQCMIWDVSTGKVQQIFNEHLHFVQGVAWDPAGEFLASISADRTCRIYSCQATATSKKQKKGGLEEKKLYKCQQILAKTDVSSSKTNVKTDSDGLIVKASALKQHLFHDETLPSFFRRLAWSPDASFLVVPSGSHKTFLEAAPCNMSYVLSRKDLSRPAIHLRGPSKPVVAVRFCPVIFSLQPNMPEEEAGCPGFSLPYRLVFALATLDSLFIYDTQHSNPIVIFAGLHYAAITDIAWSADAHYVAVSSQDGYCTLLAFSEDELGVRLPCSELPSHIASYVPETLLARGKVALNETSSEPKCNPAVQASPVSRCPRLLKHRRITPTTLPAVSSPSPQKRGQPADSPSSSQIHPHISVGPANSPSSPENCLHRCLSAAADSSPSSSLNSRHVTPTANPVDSPSESHLVTPLTTQGDSSANGSKRRLNISTSENTPSSSESCLQGIPLAAPVSALQHDQVYPVSISRSLIVGSERQSSIASTTICTDPSSSTENCQSRTPPVIPASSPLRPRKQRRIVPIAIPAESPSSPSKYAGPATAANPAEPSSLGESNSELTFPSSCRRRSGLEFRIELNMEAE